MIRTFCLTEPPNAVAAKGAQMAIRPRSNQPMSRKNVTEPVHSTVRHELAGRERRRWMTICLNVVLAGSAGCGSLTTGVSRAVTDLNECVDESMVDYRNRALAEKAWIRVRHCYAHHQYHRDFKAGFIAGYLNVATGGDGCTPAIAPEDYWGWKYQSPSGQAAVNAWFEGFPYGAKAAEEDGIGNWQSIRMRLRTPVVATGFANEYQLAPETVLPQSIQGESVPVPYPGTGPTSPSSGTPVDSDLLLEPTDDSNGEIADPNSVSRPSVRNRDQASQLPANASRVEIAQRSFRNSQTELSLPLSGPQEISNEVVNDLFESQHGNDASTSTESLPFSFE